MILWEQWTLFCAPHNKFPPPPEPQKKSSTVTKQGGGHCSTGAFVSLWWIFVSVRSLFGIYEAVRRVYCQGMMDNVRWQEQEEGYSLITAQFCVQMPAAQFPYFN